MSDQPKPAERVEAVYLGDGVYLGPGRFPGERVLTTGHHDPTKADNVVWLEPAVCECLSKALRLSIS